MWTLATLREKVWKLAAEPSDLDPTTPAGQLALDEIINEAQRELSAWRLADGQLVRFRQLMGMTNFRGSAFEVTEDGTASGSSVNIGPSVAIPGATPSTAYDGLYRDWVVVNADGEARQIVSYNGVTTVATVSPSFSNVPEVGDTLILTRSFLSFLPSTHPWVEAQVEEPAQGRIGDATGNAVEFLQIYDITNDVRLEKTGLEETMFPTDRGEPTEWMMIGNRMFFNLCFEEDTWYRLEYYRLPTEMTADGDTPEIPLQYHYGIILWCLWDLYRHEQSSGDAYSARKDLEAFMERTASSRYFRDERVMPYGTIRRT